MRTAPGVAGNGPGDGEDAAEEASWNLCAALGWMAPEQPGMLGNVAEQNERADEDDRFPPDNLTHRVSSEKPARL